MMLLDRNPYRLNLCLALFLLVLASATAFAESGADALRCSQSSDTDTVAAQRSAFNAAIRSKNLDVIGQVLTDEVLLISGTDSDVFRGREAQLALWSAVFGDPDRLAYVRTPTCIDVSSGYPIALEQGHWRGEPEVADGRFFAGRYSAKWRKGDDSWRLEVEVYMTDACGGTLCDSTQESIDTATETTTEMGTEPNGRDGR